MCSGIKEGASLAAPEAEVTTSLNGSTHSVHAVSDGFPLVDIKVGDTNTKAAVEQLLQEATPKGEVYNTRLHHPVGCMAVVGDRALGCESVEDGSGPGSPGDDVTDVQHRRHALGMHSTGASLHAQDRKVTVRQGNSIHV